MVQILLGHVMHKKKLISRRLFCIGSIISGPLHAAEPLINLDQGAGSIINSASNGPLFTRDRSMNFDMEPPLNAPGSFFIKPDANMKRNASKQNLILFNVHTNEHVRIQNHNTVPLQRKTELQKFSYLCRDWRENSSKNMDPILLDILKNICMEFAPEYPELRIDILSGYRTNSTNEKLRKQNRNVAKNSFHKKAMALDFRITGINLDRLKENSLAHATGGLGLYKSFIHIDTGPRRQWIV